MTVLFTICCMLVVPCEMCFSLYKWHDNIGSEYYNINNNNNNNNNNTDMLMVATQQEVYKVHPRTGHEGPERELMYSSTLPSTSAPDWVVGQRHAPAALPRERSGIHCIEGWVGPRAGLDGSGISRSCQDSIPGLSSP